MNHAYFGLCYEYAYLGLCYEYAHQFHVSDVVNYFTALPDVNISISINFFIIAFEVITCIL